MAAIDVGPDEPRAPDDGLVELAEGAPDQVWEGAYSDWPGGKPEVRALCRATAGGTEPLRVTHLWFPFSTYRKAVEAGDAGSAETRKAFERTGLTVGQIFARPDGLPRPSLSHFSGTLLEEALAGLGRDGLHVANISEPAAGMDVRLTGDGLRVDGRPVARPESGPALLDALREVVARAPRPGPAIPGVPFRGGLVGFCGQLTRNSRTAATSCASWVIAARRPRSPRSSH